MSKKKTTTEFIAQANIVHDNLYGYDEVVYEGNKKKVAITCHTHGIFWQTPNNHLQKKAGCPVCFGKPLKTTDEFITQANQVHNNRYGYDRVVYVNAQEKVVITCHTHGIFWQSPKNHLQQKAGCPVCFGTPLKKTAEFITQANQVHNNRYSYDDVVYVNNYEKVAITCHKHGDFDQTPNSHLSGNGCPKCSNNISKPETQWLDSLGVPTELRNKYMKLNTGRRILPDAYDPITNTVYEFHGDFWHGNPSIYSATDINPRNKSTYGELYKKTVAREELIKQSGYNLITIWEYDFKKQYNGVP